MLDSRRFSRKLVPLWRSIDHISEDPQTIVVVPSITSIARSRACASRRTKSAFFPPALAPAAAGPAHLRDVSGDPPRHRGLLPRFASGRDLGHAKKRLFLVSPLDGSARPLTEKLLERPRSRVLPVPHADPDRAHLVRSARRLDRDLALQLGIPMYGADPRFPTFNEERRPARLRRSGRPASAGHGGAAVNRRPGGRDLRLRARKPALREVVVKLDEGVSGEGNALVDLDRCSLPGSVESGAQSSRASRRCGSSSHRRLRRLRAQAVRPRRHRRRADRGKNSAARAPSSA